MDFMDLDGIDVIFKQATIDELMMSVISASPFGFDQYNKFFGNCYFGCGLIHAILDVGPRDFSLRIL